MAKARVRRVYPRARRYRRPTRASIRRRVSSAKIPLEVVIAGVTIPFTAAQDGWSTPASCASSKDWEGIARSMKTGFLGMKDGDHFDPIGLINPFDFNCGRYLKMLMVGGIAHKIRTKFVKIPMKKVPLVGRYIS